MVQFPNVTCLNCKRAIRGLPTKLNKRVVDAQGKNTKCPWCKQHIAPRQSMRNSREKRK